MASYIDAPVGGSGNDTTQQPRHSVLDDEKSDRFADDMSSTRRVETRQEGRVHTEADGFGTGANGESYRKMGRWRTTLIFVTNQVGIGVLSLPDGLRVLGIIPGIIAIIGLGLLATYTAYILVQFYRKYPQILNVVDCARIMGGKWLEIITGIAFVLNLILICSAANVTMSIAFNTMTNHAICTVGFIGIPMLICFLLCIPRKMDFLAWVGIPCTISIIASVMIVMISLGIEGPPNPNNEPLEIVLVGNPTFQQGFEAVLNIAFAYAGNQAFLTVMAEMRDPSRDFVPAIWILQAFGIPLYTIVAGVIYGFAGQFVVSPALGSAPRLPRDIAYGVVLVTLFGTGMVFGHTAIKYVYVVMMRNVLKSRHHLTDNNKTTWGLWLGIGAVFWILAFILANAIPLFSSILGISSALFVSWFTFGMPAAQWIFLNWGRQFSNWRKTSLAVVNWLLILTTMFMTGVGMWSSIDLMLGTYNNPNVEIAGSFTCANNAPLLGNAVAT